MAKFNGAGYMKFFVLASVAAMWVSTAAAHQCVLAGNSAADISAYNACKADLAQGSTGHDHHQAGARITALEAENAALRRKLDLVKGRLFELLKDVAQ
jgi:hypothetical protein